MDEVEKGYGEYKSSIIRRIRVTVRAAPNNLAIVYGKTRLTYREMDERTNAIANALLDLGLRRGDHTMTMDYNTNQCIEGMFAGIKIGVPFANLNYRYTPEEIAYVCNNNEAKVVFLNEVTAETMRKALPKCKTVEHLIVTGENVPDDMLGFEDLVAKYPKTFPDIEKAGGIPKDSDPLFYLYTGGTTGMPKGAIVTHGTIIPFINKIIGIFGKLFPRLADAPKEVWDGIGNILPIPGISSILNSRITKEVLRSPALPGILNKIAPILTSPAAIPLAHTVLPLTVGKNFKWLTVCPLAHAWGAMWGVLTPILMGATSVLPVSKSFDPRETCEVIERERINGLAFTGDGIGRPLANFLDENRGKYDLSSLILVTSGGMHLSPEVAKRLLEHAPQMLPLDILASSETLGVGANVFLSSDKELPEPGVLKVTDNIPVKIFNTATGEMCDPGELGEVAICTGDQTVGYYKDEKKTAETYRIIDGKSWVFSGDMGFIDENGDLHLVGRGSECINTGGEKVFPDEVENIIRENPKVEDVAITGVPDERWGEAVTAVVELKKGEKATAEEIKEFCKGKIAGYKIPKHVIFVDEIPKTNIYKTSYKEIKMLAKREVLGSA